MSRITLVLAVLVLLLFTLSPRAEGVENSVENQIPERSILSLQAAEKFLSYWANRDGRHGPWTLSKRLRNQINDEAFLMQYFSGMPNPSHAAYTLGKGKRIGNDTVCFEVELFEIAMGAEWGSSIQSTFRVVREGLDWKVDTLPYNGETEHREAFAGCVAK